MRVQIQILPHGADLPLPRYATDGAAGMDLRAAITEPLSVEPNNHRIIPCGVAVAIPFGFELQIRPRSGLALRHHLTILNTPGTVDSDYRGEIQVLLFNLGIHPFSVFRGDRIAQAVLCPVMQCEWDLVQRLPSTARATGGYGSTGV